MSVDVCFCVEVDIDTYIKIFFYFRRDSLFEANINVGNGSAITLKMSPRSVHTVIYNKLT